MAADFLVGHRLATSLWLIARRRADCKQAVSATTYFMHLLLTPVMFSYFSFLIQSFISITLCHK